MVHIVDENGTSTEDEQDESRYKWQEMMGEDIQLKVVGGVVNNSGGGGMEGVKQPEVGDCVFVTLKCTRGKLEGGVPVNFGDVIYEEKNAMYTVGDGEVCPGLELGLRFLKVGERGEVFAGRRCEGGAEGWSDATPIHRVCVYLYV